MVYLDSLEMIRSVNWGRKYLWDMRFDPTTPAPAPFNTWFPAVTVDEDIAKLESHSVPGFLTDYNIPLRSKQKFIKITLEDDVKNTLSQWFSQWVNVTILQHGNGIAALTTAVKFLHLVKLNPDRTPITQADYWVYPDGDITWNGTSETGSQQFTVNFVIAGISAITTSLPSGTVI